MPDSVSERRLVENEVMSRKPNEKISKDLDYLYKIAQEDGQEHLVPEIDANILFFCECSDENCKERIALNKSKYDAIHKSRKYFLLVPGHNIPSIEQTIQVEDDYMVVEKFKLPPDDVTQFHKTDVDNTGTKS